MSRQSGFVPIRFRLVGQILCGIGGAGLLITLLSAFGRWFEVPLILTLFSLAVLIVGLYLIFVVPPEPLE